MFNAFNNLKECFNSIKGCGWVELAPFVNAILKNLVIIGLLIAAIMVSYAGWTLLEGLGSAEARSGARRILINVVIGLIILFGAYFIVDLILTKLFVDPEFRGFLPKQ